MDLEANLKKIKPEAARKQHQSPLVGQMFFLKDLKEAVKSDSIIAAALGGEANFYCNFLLSMDVLQVTWQKRNKSSFQNIATYSPNHGLRLIGSFQKKVHFTRATLKASAMTLQNLTFEDESYYRCIFNVFPHGSFSKDICLNIQSVQKSIIIVGVITVVFLAILIFCIVKLIKRQRKKLKRHDTPRTPAKEEGLHQDLSEKAVSLHTPKDQHVVCQNEKQTPGCSLHKRLLCLKRNPREEKHCRRLFSEEVDNPNSNVHVMFEREPVALCFEELSCTPVNEDRSNSRWGSPNNSPPQEEETSAH
ncbi:uncharacterized protein LOC104253039 [Gavia stellata]|uniref:uncharacterized protein LOC104253039 n=1 Tax=Gavia stellata TaxID=37040 RepID=UPI0028A238BF|nr:uncharacterized protein LOC104253039 [Gavia stellata]